MRKKIFSRTGAGDVDHCCTPYFSDRIGCCHDFITLKVVIRGKYINLNKITKN